MTITLLRWARLQKAGGLDKSIPYITQPELGSPDLNSGPWIKASQEIIDHALAKPRAEGEYIGQPPDMTLWLMERVPDEYMQQHYGYLPWRGMDDNKPPIAAKPYKRPPLTRFADTLFLQYMQSRKRGLRAWLLLRAVKLCELFERREAW